MLGDPRLLHIAHAAVDLHGQRGHLRAHVGAEALRQGGVQLGQLPGPVALGGTAQGRGAVDGGGVGVDQAAHGVDPGPLGHQHPAHVGVIDDRARRAPGGADGGALEALGGIGQGLLVGALRQGQPLEPDREAGVVHHGEHVAHPVALLPDEPADGPVGLAVAEHTGGTGVDAELVLQRHAGDVIALPQLTAGAHQVLGYQEHGDAPGAGGRVGGAGQDEVDDVVGQIVLAVGDEDLLTPDPVGAVTHGLGPTGEGPHIRPGLRLGQVHGASPLAGEHAGEVEVLLLGRAMVLEGVDGALGQQGAQGEGHVGAGQHLLDDDGHRPREAPAPVAGVEGDGPEAGGHILLVGRLEPFRGGDRGVVIADRPGLVAHPVEGSHHLGHEPPHLGHDLGHEVGIDLGERRGGEQAWQVDDGAEHEADVVEGRRVGVHRCIVTLRIVGRSTNGGPDPGAGASATPHDLWSRRSI